MRPRSCRLCVGATSAGVLALLLAAAPLSAQVAELTVGARVRVRAPEAVAGRLTGVIIARGGDTLTVTRSNALPLTLRVPQLTAVEVSRGRSRWLGARHGALWGGGVMGVLGVLFVDGATTCEGAGPNQTCREATAVESAAYGAVSGVLLGGLIGAFVGRERWQHLSLPRVAVVPPGGGARRSGTSRNGTRDRSAHVGIAWTW